MPPPSLKPTSSGRIRWSKAFQLAKIGPRQEEIARARGALQQAQGQADYAKSLLDATVIRAPVTGTILERAAEKGELVTSGFASTAEGGPQGLVVSLADLNDLQVELDIAQDDFARLGPKQKAVVTTDAYPDRKYDGVIAEISPQANRAKATVQVKVQILKPDAYSAAGHEFHGQIPGGRSQACEFAAAGSFRAHRRDQGPRRQEDRLPGV